MSLKRPTGDLKSKIIPALVLMFIVLFSGTNSVMGASPNSASPSPNARIAAVTSIPQFRLTEWLVPSLGGGPVGVAVDQSGLVWVTENSTSKLARFDPSNNNFTEWNTPTGGSQPRNIFVKQVSVSGVSRTQVFFTEYALNSIARFDFSSNTVAEWRLPAGSKPVGIFVDENNDIWFTESGRDIIGKIHPADGNLTEWTLPGATATPGSPILKPWGILIQLVPRLNLPTNRFVWFTASSNNTIGRLHVDSGRLTLWYLNSLGLGSYQPTDITNATVNGFSSIIFANANSNRISILGNDTGGPLTTYRESFLPTSNTGPAGVTFDNSRNAIWFGEVNAGNVGSLNTTATIIPVTLTASYCTISPYTGTPSCPSSSTKNAIVVPIVSPNPTASSIIRVPALSSTIGIFQGPINGVTEYSLPNRTARPNDIALDSGGNLWFTESNVTVNRIGRLSIPYVFSVIASPTTASVNQGQSTTFAVNVGLSSGNPLPLDLTLSNAPPNATATFNLNHQNPPFVSTLTIATSISTPVATYTMTIQGTSGGQTQQTSISLSVGLPPPPPPVAFDYSITVTSPSQVMVPQGASAYFDLSVSLTSGTSQFVTLSATGFPAGTTYSFDTPPAKPTFSSRLSLQTSSGTPAGTYPIAVTGISSGGSPHSPAQSPVLIVTEVFRDFNFSSLVTQVVLVQSSKTDIPITVYSIGSFSGDVDFSTTFSPAQKSLGATFTPAPVTLEINGTTQTTMEIMALKNTVGTYQMTVTATSSNPTRTHQIVISIRVSQCLIATAAFGSELAPEVQFLRDFRDQQIMPTFAGSNFMTFFNAWYYSFSPAVADYEYSHATTRALIKLTLYPLMGILNFASLTYTALGFEPETATLAAGLVSGSIIGLVYFALPLAGLFWINRERIDARTKGRFAKWLVLAFVALIAGFVLSESFAIPVLMGAVGVGLVLTSLIAGSFIPAFVLVERAKRRF